MKKPSLNIQQGSAAAIPKQSAQVTDSRRQMILAGAWRLADLLEMSHCSPEMLRALRSIHLSARQVIGGNLARRSLDRLTLERLRASVLRQADQAGELQEKLAVVKASDVLRVELTELQVFFDGILIDIARKLGTKH